MQQQHSAKFLRHRKFLLVLPVLVIPFVTMAFWALGGGTSAVLNGEDLSNKTGLNLDLPGANLKEDDAVDKLGYYEKAASDSARLRELMKGDPYFDSNLHEEDSIPKMLLPTQYPQLSSPYSMNPALQGSSSDIGKYIDPNEAKVYQKIAQLNSALNDGPTHNNPVDENYQSTTSEPTTNNEDGARIEQMMQKMNKSEGSSEDSEMKQLNGMLEKILDIQHPDRMQEKMKEKSLQNRDVVFTVTVDDSKMSISLLDTATKKVHNPTDGFYGWSNQQSKESAQNAIEAVVHETQTLVNGAIVKMRLLNDIYINGHLISKENFVYGTVSLNNERLEINIGSIRDEHSLFPVKLEVYDMDGLPGLYIPGAITRDVTKQSTDNAIQSVALSSLDPSIGAQAASAGIEAAKTLLSKKVKLIKVQVKAGYKILIKDNNQQ